MKRLSFLFFLLISQLSIAQTAYTADQIPNPKNGVENGFVSNPDGVLSSTEVAQLNQTISQLESKTKVEIAVVVVKDFQENTDDFEFALQLFNKWGIGKAKANNGLLLFVSIDQRKFRLITGYGLEGLLPDLKLKKIATRYLVPPFKEGKYEEGISSALNMISDYLTQPENRKELDQLLGPERGWLYFGLDPLESIGVIVLLFFLVFFHLKRRTPKVSVKGNDEYTKSVATGCAALAIGTFLLPFIIGFTVGFEWLTTLKANSLPLVVYVFLAIILYLRYLSTLGAIRRLHYDEQNFQLAAERFNRWGYLYMICSPLILITIWKENKRRKNSVERFKAPLDQSNREMIWVDRDQNKMGDPFLTKGQESEERERVYDYDIWRSTDGKQVKAIPFPASNYASFENCPKCNARTLSGVRKVTLTTSSYTREGEGKEVKECENCGYEEFIKLYVIYKRVRSSSSESSSSSGSSSSSSSSSSGSSSSWGGGSSGGGGSGGSW